MAWDKKWVTPADLALKEDKINKVTAFQVIPDDTAYPSEKLVKDSLDDKEDLINKVTAFQVTPDDTAYPSEKLVKDSLDDKEDKINKVTAFQVTPDNTAYPSEKLVKDSLDDKVDKETGKGLSETSVSQTEKNTWNGKQDALGFTPENLANKGQNNGYASLDAGGKVPVGQLPSSVMHYLGTWNADTNTPTLSNGMAGAINGDVYLCSVAGTTNFGAGDITFAIGDWAIYNGTIWEKSLNSNAVVSVNSQTGVVSLTQDNIGNGTTYKQVSQTEKDGWTATTTKQNLVIDITKEPTGFAEPENVIVSYDGTARKVTLTGTVNAYYKGAKVAALVSGWESDEHDAASGTYFLSYNGTNFVWGTTPWDFTDLLIALVFRDTANFCLRECHGLMQWQTHKHLHETQGTYLLSGGDLSGFTLNSETATDRRPLISETKIVDEDLTTTLPAISTNSYARLWLSGANNANIETEQTEIARINGTVPRKNTFDGTNWIEEDFQNNEYGKIFVMAIPTTADAECQKSRFIFVQPQSATTNIANARAVTAASVNLGHISLALAEFVFIAEILIRRQGGGGGNWRIIEANKLTGTRTTQISTPTGNFLSSVTTDDTLTGDGTAADPLGLSLTKANTFSVDDANAFRVRTAGGTDVFNVDTLTGEATGNTITTTGVANKLVKTDASGNIVATGGITTGGASSTATNVVRTNNANAFRVRTAGGTDVFNVDTDTQSIGGSGVTTTGVANKLVKTTATGGITAETFVLSSAQGRSFNRNTNNRNIIKIAEINVSSDGISGFDLDIASFGRFDQTISKFRVTGFFRNAGTFEFLSSNIDAVGSNSLAFFYKLISTNLYGLYLKPAFTKAGGYSYAIKYTASGVNTTTFVDMTDTGSDDETGFTAITTNLSNVFIDKGNTFTSTNTIRTTSANALRVQNQGGTEVFNVNTNNSGYSIIKTNERSFKYSFVGGAYDNIQLTAPCNIACGKISVSSKETGGAKATVNTYAFSKINATIDLKAETTLEVGNPTGLTITNDVDNIYINLLATDGFRYVADVEYVQY